MTNFLDHVTVRLSGKNHYALLAFLKRHGYGKEDVDRFVEEAVAWRMLDRDMAVRHAPKGGEALLFSQPPYEDDSTAA